MTGAMHIQRRRFHAHSRQQPRSRQRVPAKVSPRALTLKVAALAGTLVLAITATSCDAPEPVSEPAVTPGSGKVVVIGDSLSTGMGTSPAQAWPTLLQNDSDTSGLQLQVTNASRNGSGYISVGDDDATFDSEITSSVDPDAQVVLVFGSENDMGTEPAQLTQAARTALAHAKAAAPHAALIVVGPPSYTSTPEADRIAVRNADKAAAASAGAIFIDPIAAHWIMGSADQLIGPDGDHPSTSGQQYLKAKMKQILLSCALHPVPSHPATSPSLDSTCPAS